MNQTPDVPISLPALVAERATASPATTILRYKARGIWHAVTWGQLAEEVRRIGGGLHDLGLGHGNAACIIAETRPETAYVDIAVQSCGAASVIIHNDTEATRIEHILRATASRVAVAENEEQLDKILSVRGRCPALSRIVILDMKGLREFSDPQCVSLTAFARGAGGYDWFKAARGVSGNHQAVILFGKHDSTAAGQVLLQRDVVELLGKIRGRLGLRPRDERLALLGMSDPVERIWGLYAALDNGCISNYLERPDTAIENLQELQPTVLGTDAQVWAHLHARTVSAAKSATAVQRFLYGWAVRSAHRGGWLARVADLLVLGAVRRELGLRRLRLAYMGDEAVSPATLDWARSLGVRIQRIEASGMVEGPPDKRHGRMMQKAPA